MREPCETLPPYDHVNAYVVASNGVAMVVDPGSGGPEAVRALDAALVDAGTRLVKGVLLTHTHPDHTGGLAALPELARDAALFVHAAEARRLGAAARPTLLADGRRLVVGDAVLRTVHTPGHSPGHLAFALEPDRAVLVGDLLAGAGSTWVGAPEGDVAAYLASLARVSELDARVLGPGHGPAIHDPADRLAWARDHRLERERQVVDALAGEPRTLDQLGRAVYPGLEPEARPYAEASLLAHLRKLMAEMRVVHLGDDESGPFALRR